MKLMSDALEKAAGAKMRSILGVFHQTPLRGILVGTFFTAVIQSSSVYCYGSQLCKLRSDESLSGGGATGC